MTDLDVKRGRELLAALGHDPWRVVADAKLKEWLRDNAPALLDAAEDRVEGSHAKRYDECVRLRARIAELEAERVTAADAWDDGFRRSLQRGGHVDDNPYRKGES